MRSLEHECKKKTSQLAQANIDIRHLTDKLNSPVHTLPTEGTPIVPQSEVAQPPTEVTPLEAAPAAVAAAPDPIGTRTMVPVV